MGPNNIEPLEINIVTKCTLATAYYSAATYVTLLYQGCDVLAPNTRFDGPCIPSTSPYSVPIQDCVARA